MALPPQLKMTTALCLLSVAAALSLGSYAPESYLDITYGHGLPTYGPSLPPPYASGLASQGPLQEVFQYNQLQYNVPLGAQFDNGAYDPSRNVFTGLELTRDRIFLAVPRLYPGVPSTINFVPRVSSVPNPPLQPFPGWEWQSPNGIGGYGANCSGLVSVYRIRADRCNRLWVLDSGLTNSLAGFIPVCTPKLIAFDLSTDQPVRTITFPRAALRPSTLLTNLVIDDVDGPARDPRCDRLVFYLSDTAVPAIVVYDSGRDQVRRISDLSMYPDPDFGMYTINGESFSLMDGVIGMALSPPPNRVLYFQPLATDKVFSVPTSALRDFAAGESQMLPVSLVGRKSSAGAGLATDRDGILYFSPIQENAVAFYDPNSGRQAVIASDDTRLQFAAELRIDETDGSLWLLSTRFQKFFLNTINPNEVNLRVIRIPREAIQGGHRVFARSTSNSTAVF
ncbi:dopaminechrome tautomerase-like [Hetaerina americana]|uniref:dopaminechrome tautomerase-like n=1 Tax=Hetaerina americana TaxID=62018 RepID=UPI003A7F37F4